MTVAVLKHLDGHLHVHRDKNIAEVVHWNRHLVAMCLRERTDAEHLVVVPERLGSYILDTERHMAGVAA